MQLNEFTLLPPDDKVVTVLNSTILAAFGRNEEIWLLYSLGSFYVELLFDRKCCQATEVRLVENTEALLPYLHDVRINSLLAISCI
jgi:hypothetical protein